VQKLKDDWKIATIFEKIRFILACLFMIGFGCIGVWYAILYYVASESHNNDGIIKYGIVVLASMIGLFALKAIKLSPKKHKDVK
jgi:hypothetical protein